MSGPSATTSKRVTWKIAHPNAPIEELLQKLYRKIMDIDEKAALQIKRALHSLSKYPLPLHSGSDCAILQGFDKRLCEYINDQMRIKKKKTRDNAAVIQKSPSSPPPPYTAESASDSLTNAFKPILNEKTELPCPSKGINGFKSSCKTARCNCSCDICNENTSKNTIPSKEHIAKHLNNLKLKGRQHDAVLIALYEQQQYYPHSRPALTREELILKAQKYIIRDNNKKYDNTWSILKLLESKKRYIRVVMHENVQLYTLTDLGWEVGQRLTNMNFDVSADILYNSRPHDRVPCCVGMPLTPPRINQLNLVKDDDKLFIDMPPGTYDIAMIVDKNEPELPRVSNGTVLNQIDTRSLKVGDVMWVARSKTDSQELVLPFILERKRMDDFAASIKDGRFHEQKFRLRKCGLRNVIYLIEDYNGNKRCGLPLSALQQAMANTRVQDGFLVHHTDSLKGTTKFLDMISYRLAMELKDTHLRGSNTNSDGRELMTFEYFNHSAAKTKPLTIKELFIKMLLQLRGLSVEKALAITNKYNSPKALMLAYDKCSEKEGQLLLANLKFSATSSQVGPNISKILYMLFTKEKL